jgi:hypothetical protein
LSAKFTGAVFRSTSTLLDATHADRVPGAIAPLVVSPGSAFPFITPPTAYGHEPTDILADFLVRNRTQAGVTVEVPVGAEFLFVSSIDVSRSDNSDPNHDHGVIGSSMPEQEVTEETKRSRRDR